ncbi:hypothetical protein [Streptomyces avermitilis]|uniref:hypothetical protein n=1 Tax=Streptomyces avermitilis TaxID=33903 RepID=UPI00382A9BA3
MEWMALASTIVGGGIATVSAGLHERRRWKRDRGDQRIELRRNLYGTYLSGLSRARLACSVLARDPDASLSERRKAAWDAFEPCVSLRYQIAISAPAAVVTPAENVFRRLRDLRDATAEGLLLDSNAYAIHRTDYDTALQALRGAMRDDLGADA